jgi:hypothetical protein
VDGSCAHLVAERALSSSSLLPLKVVGFMALRVALSLLELKVRATDRTLTASYAERTRSTRSARLGEHLLRGGYILRRLHQECVVFSISNQCKPGGGGEEGVLAKQRCWRCVFRSENGSLWVFWGLG